MRPQGAVPPDISLPPARSLASDRLWSGSADPAAAADLPVAGSPRGLTGTTPVALAHAVAPTSFCSVAPRSEPPLAVDSGSESASAPCDADATTVAAGPDSPHSVSRSWENDSPSATAEYAAHPADPSSACVRASWRSHWRPRSTTRSSVLPGVAQTSVHAHWLPLPLVPSCPGQRGHDKTPLLPCCALIVALRNLRSRYPQTLFAGSPGDNRIL